MKVRVRSAIALLAQAGCAHTLTPTEVFDQGRHGDAIEMLRHEEPGETDADRLSRSNEQRRLMTLHRRTHPARVLARVVPALEIEKLTGVSPSAIYGTTILLVETHVAPESASEYSLYGSIGLEGDPDEYNARGHWIAVDVEREHVMTAHVVAQLWTLPEAPSWKCTLGDGVLIPPSLGDGLLGLALLFSGITPMASLASGSNQITPNLPHGRYIPGKDPGKCEPPSDAELAAWAELPPVHAGMTLEKMVRGDTLAGAAAPSRITLMLWTEGWKKMPPNQTSLLVGVSERLKTSRGKELSTMDSLFVPLAQGGTTSDQITRTFSAGGVDVAPLESRPWR